MFISYLKWTIYFLFLHLTPIHSNLYLSCYQFKEQKIKKIVWFKRTTTVMLDFQAKKQENENV